MDSSSPGPIAVYGATGHTGRFVVGELRRRGLPFLAVGRDVSRLDIATARRATLDDAASLDRALAGCSVVVNCAGPFMDTAAPVIEAALRAGACYLDVSAEQPSASASLSDFAQRARDARVAVVPAAGFYGGLADLLATALAGQAGADRITVAVALDHWWPTPGTRSTGARNTSPRVVVENGALVPMALPPRQAQWDFGPPFGDKAVVQLGFSEIVTIAHHLRTQALHSWFATGPLAELRDASTPPPQAVDAQGRSSQRFVMDVVAETADGRRTARAAGQDIYAVSAPIVVEAAQRLREQARSASRLCGTFSLGEAFDAREFLESLAEHMDIDMGMPDRCGQLD